MSTLSYGSLLLDISIPHKFPLLSAIEHSEPVVILWHIYEYSEDVVIALSKFCQFAHVVCSRDSDMTSLGVCGKSCKGATFASQDGTWLLIG